MLSVVPGVVIEHQVALIRVRMLKQTKRTSPKYLFVETGFWIQPKEGYRISEYVFFFN